jgi:hypothetical protein
MYHDLGCKHFKRQSSDQQENRQALVRAWYAVELTPLAA